MNEKELATVLAALRFWQRNTFKISFGFLPETTRSEYFKGSGISPLTDDEINSLCEKLKKQCSQKQKEELCYINISA